MNINSVVNSQIIHKQQKFKGNSAENNSAKNSKNQRPNFFKKLITHPSLIIIPLVPIFGYDIYNRIKEKSLKKACASSEEIKKFNKSSIKTAFAFFALAIPLYFATDYINKKYKEKNFAKVKKQVDEFNQKYNVNIKPITSPIDKKNPMKLGVFSPITAQIMIPEKVYEDMINANFKRKSIIRHELIHAQQHIMMACSKNGINKMNYLCVKKISKKLSAEQKLDIQKTYDKIQGNDKYKNKTVKISDYEINALDYYTALYKVIYDKNANPDNIPIIINKEFYEKAKVSKGHLTEKEEIKAQKYLEAYEKYPTKIDFLDMQNPFSDYRQNLLEKEAYGNQHKANYSVLFS